MSKYDPSLTALLSPEISDQALIAGEIPELALYAEAARLAYIRAEQSPIERARLKTQLSQLGYALKSFVFSTTTGAFAYVAVHTNLTHELVSFRGTQLSDLADIATNLNVSLSGWPYSVGKVHAGFANAFDSLLQDLRATVAANNGNSSLHLVGHSLGGAMAMLATHAFPNSHVTTYGCPRVGDEVFLNATDLGQLRRVVNCCDIVCSLPPESHGGYAHPPHMLYLDSGGVLHKDPSEDLISNDQQQGRASYLSNLAWRPGSLLVRELADHSPINYVNLLKESP